jgi:hypothetical protein
MRKLRAVRTQADGRSNTPVCKLHNKPRLTPAPAMLSEQAMDLG